MWLREIGLCFLLAAIIPIVGIIQFLCDLVGVECPSERDINKHINTVIYNTRKLIRMAQLSINDIIISDPAVESGIWLEGKLHGQNIRAKIRCLTTSPEAAKIDQRKQDRFKKASDSSSSGIMRWRDAMPTYEEELQDDIDYAKLAVVEIDINKAQQAWLLPDKKKEEKGITKAIEIPGLSDEFEITATSLNSERALRRETQLRNEAIGGQRIDKGMPSITPAQQRVIDAGMLVKCLIKWPLKESLEGEEGEKNIQILIRKSTDFQKGFEELAKDPELFSIAADMPNSELEALAEEKVESTPENIEYLIRNSVSFRKWAIKQSKEEGLFRQRQTEETTEK